MGSISQKLVLAFIIIFIGSVSYIYTAQPTEDFPVTVTVTNSSAVDEVYFADHTDSLMEGNWFKLGGGKMVELPPIFLSYSGVNYKSYTNDGRTVEINSTFSDKNVTYPLAEHRVYVHGDDVVVNFYGDASFTGVTVEFRLINCSRSQLTDVYSGTLEGDLGPLKNLLSSHVWNTSKQLDASGDASFNISAPDPGDYLLIGLGEESVSSNYTLRLYSFTLVEVLDYDIDVEAPSSVILNEFVDLDVNHSGPESSTGYRYGAFMVHEDSYRAEVLVRSDGSLDGTNATVNGCLLVNGSDLKLSNLNTDYLQTKLAEAFGGDNISVAFSDPVNSTQASLSLATDTSMPTGRYILFTAVFEQDTGRRIVAFRQSEVWVLANITIELYPGWNLVGMNLEPVDARIEAVLGDNVSKVDYIYFYNGSWTSWFTLFPGSSSLKELNGGRGYWFHCNTGFNLTVNGSYTTRRPIIPGWNMIAINDTSPVSTTTYLQDTAWTAVYGYDEETSTWKSYFKGVGGTLATLDPGEGYWVEAD